MKTKILKLINLPRLLALLGLVLLVLVSQHGLLWAQQVTQGYGSDHALERGTIVRLSQADPTKVTAAKADEAGFIHGVVVAPNDAPLTLSDENQKVFVATNGRFEVLVSNQNGHIKDGDYITISATQGIGMKANETTSHVVGKAIAAFNESTAVAGQSKVNGRTVQYGRVLADIGVAVNPFYKSADAGLPGLVRQTAQAIGGKPVSSFRVYVAGFLALATVLITGSILYSGIRSSITAIGRNPLSRLAVSKGLLKVVLTGLIVFLSGVFAVYLLLKL